MRITIPRWVQLVLIPVAIFLALYFAKVASHAVFVFLIVGRGGPAPQPGGAGHEAHQGPALAGRSHRLSGLRRRGGRCSSSSSGRLWSGSSSVCSRPSPAGWTISTACWPICEAWLAHAQHRGQSAAEHRLTSSTGCRHNGASSVGTLFSVGRSVVGVVVNIFLTVVVSFYMLIDGKRIFRFLCRFAPGEPEVKEEYVRGLQTAFSRFVRGQALLGATIGLACWTRHLDPELGRRGRLAGGRSVRSALRLLGGHHRGHPLRGPVPRRRPAGHRRLLPLADDGARGSSSSTSSSSNSRATSWPPTSWAARWGCTRWW